MNNNKNRDRFVTLAEKRVTKAMKDLRLIGNLANRNNYSYTQEDAQKILSTLERELKLLKKRFESVSSSSEVLFKL